jgi:hypothetical protein
MSCVGVKMTNGSTAVGNGLGSCNDVVGDADAGGVAELAHPFSAITNNALIEDCNNLE